MQDFPNHTACIVWFGGCNMRCQYCHNPDMILCAKGTYSTDELLAFLETRKGKLDGVVFTGGEASLYPDILKLAKQVKSMGFKLKLDTNGTKPDVVQQFLDSRLVDYIALDYKAPPAKFKQVTGSNKYAKLSETLNLLCRQKIPFEIRTTVHTGLLNEADVQWIIDDLVKRNCQAPHYIQNYMHTETIGKLTEQVEKLNFESLTSAGGVIGFRNF